MSEEIKKSDTIYAVAESSSKESSTSVPFSASKTANSIGYYQFEKAIGEGNFAKVKLAIHTVTGEKVKEG